jgi:hypothetical protein
MHYRARRGSAHGTLDLHARPYAGTVAVRMEGSLARIAGGWLHNLSSASTGPFGHRSASGMRTTNYARRDSRSTGTGRTD